MRGGGRTRGGDGWRIAALATAALVLAGCGREIDTSYGDVRGTSINGLSAFVQLVRDTGHATTARQTLPRDVQGRYGAVIVFESLFGERPAAMAAELEGLVAHPGAVTLVLVARDGDCAIDYFRALAARDDLDAAIREEARRRFGDASARLAAATDEPRPAAAPGQAALEPCSRAAGETAAGIDVEIAGNDEAAPRRVRARWPLGRRLVPGADGRVLWRSGADPLLVESTSETPVEIPGDLLGQLGEAAAGRETAAQDEAVPAEIMLPSDRVIEIASAVPFLNGGLVDPGNRLLAEDLVARLPPGERVLVVGSSWTSASTAEDEPEPSLLRLLAIPPLPWVAVQAAAALGLFCWWKSPIFGRPRGTPASHAQDFGHHVEALASLLAKCRSGPQGATGTRLARRRLEEWKRQTAAAVTRAAGPKPRRGRDRWQT